MVRSIFSSRSLGYIAYAVLLTVVFLYVRFPEQKFKTFFEKRFERMIPGTVCNIGRIGYRFPMSAVFDSIQFSRMVDGQETNLVVKMLVIAPELPQFWKTFTVQGEMYSGRFGAELNIDARGQTFQLAEVHLQGLDAGEFAERIGITERKMSGAIEFSGSYQGKSSTPSEGVGRGVVQVVNGSMGLLQPILAISTIEFEKMAINVSQENGTLRFAEGKLQGKDVQVDFSGELRLASPLLNSTILLQGNLAPEEAYLLSRPRERQIVQRLLQRYKATVLPFRVGGTLQRPLFRFST